MVPRARQGFPDWWRPVSSCDYNVCRYRTYPNCCRGLNVILSIVRILKINTAGGTVQCRNLTDKRKKPVYKLSLESWWREKNICWCPGHVIEILFSRKLYFCVLNFKCELTSHFRKSPGYIKENLLPPRSQTFLASGEKQNALGLGKGLKSGFAFCWLVGWQGCLSIFLDPDELESPVTQARVLPDNWPWSLADRVFRTLAHGKMRWSNQASLLINDRRSLGDTAVLQKNSGFWTDELTN